MSRNFILATKEERLLADFLEDGAKQHSEIITELGKHGISESKTNRLLKLSEGKIAFRVMRKDGKVFYRLNIFPRKAVMLFTLADQLPKDWELQHSLMEIKNELLRSYPNVPFERVLERWRLYIKKTKPEWKGVPDLLKFFEKAEIL